jgi:uncharacterized protein
MHPRAAELIRLHHLKPHPEGGYYGELYRSSSGVRPHDGRYPRPAMTVIFFLLTAGQHSRWHRVRSDELWHACEGHPLILFEMSADLRELQQVALGDGDSDARWIHVVPAGAWQAARSRGAYTLVTCTVAPGFVFEDFDFMRGVPEAADAVRAFGTLPRFGNDLAEML